MQNNEQEPQGFALAFFQKNPKVKPKIQAILSLESDGRIYVQTAGMKRPYASASLVTPDGHPLLADSLNYLKELARQSKLSQITYEYTENTDRVAEYNDLLMQGTLTNPQ
jgi:hypothetical protein